MVCCPCTFHLLRYRPRLGWTRTRRWLVEQESWKRLVSAQPLELLASKEGPLRMLLMTGPTAFVSPTACVVRHPCHRRVLMRCDHRRPKRKSDRSSFASLLWRSEEHTSELQSLRHLVC